MLNLRLCTVYGQMAIGELRHVARVGQSRIVGVVEAATILRPAFFSALSAFLEVPGKEVRILDALQEGSGSLTVLVESVDHLSNGNGVASPDAALIWNIQVVQLIHVRDGGRKHHARRGGIVDEVSLLKQWQDGSLSVVAITLSAHPFRTGRRAATTTSAAGTYAESKCGSKARRARTPLRGERGTPRRRSKLSPSINHPLHN